MSDRKPGETREPAPYGAPTSEPRHEPESVREVFDRALEYARVEAERERLDAAERTGIFWKLLTAVQIGSILVAVAVGGYGIFMIDEPPIRQTRAGYVSKSGRPRTREDFERYRMWERGMFVTVPGAIAINFAGMYLKDRHKRRRARRTA